jgi:hypothetical protein
MNLELATKHSQLFGVENRMSRKSEIELTNMCLVYNENSILGQKDYGVRKSPKNTAIHGVLGGEK